MTRLTNEFKLLLIAILVILGIIAATNLPYKPELDNTPVEPKTSRVIITDVKLGLVGVTNSYVPMTRVIYFVIGDDGIHDNREWDDLVKVNYRLVKDISLPITVDVDLSDNKHGLKEVLEAHGGLDK